MVNLSVGGTVYVVRRVAVYGRGTVFTEVCERRVVSYDGDAVCVVDLGAAGHPLQFHRRDELHPTREAAEAAAKGGPDRG